MTTDLVYLANFWNRSVTGLFALAWENQFFAYRKISYTNQKNQFFMPKEIYIYAYTFLDVFGIRLSYFVLVK